MRVAVIGCGSVGSRHAANLVALGHYPVLFDTEAVSRALGQSSAYGECHTWPQRDTFVAFDAALICTPAHTHAAVARELLEHGYRGPLFVEKPIATSAADAEVFESWPHPTLMVGYNWRFNRDVTAWQIQWGGVLPAHLTFVLTTNVDEWPGHDYAAPLLECSHELDLAFAILGPTLKLTSADVRTNGAQLYLSTAATSVRLDLFWRGAWKGHRSFIARFVGDHARRAEPSQASVDQSYVEELAHFLDCAKHNRRPDCTAMDGVRVLDILEEAKVHV